MQDEQILEFPTSVPIIETEIAHNWLNEKGWFCSVSKDVKLTVANLTEHYKKAGEMNNGKPACFLVQPNFSESASPESRRYMNSILHKHCVAIALLTNNSMMRVGINLYNQIMRPSVPMKVFADVQSATAWLEEMEK